MTKLLKSNKLTLGIIFLGLVLFLTNCVFCAACSSSIDNKTDQDIYVILKTADKYDITIFRHFAKDSKINKFKLDTLTNTGTFIIPSNGHLLTYDGPGSNPARILSSLKIITTKEIIEMKSQNEIENSFDKNVVNYKLTVKLPE